jgi:hypothetical protein
MYKIKNTLLVGALFTSILFCPISGWSNGDSKPGIPENPPTTLPKQETDVSASGVSVGVYYGRPSFYQPYAYYYPYRPFYYNYYYAYPYQPYYYNYYGW